jgi:hypothetical protein
MQAQIWMLPALIIYLTERTVRWLWPSVRSADLVDVHLLPGKERVICLRLRKPISFHYSCVPDTLQPLQEHLKPPSWRGLHSHPQDVAQSRQL